MRRPRRTPLIALVTATAVLPAACGAHRAPPAPPESVREGRTSVRVLTVESQTEPSDVEVERITPAFASEANGLPRYPAHALEAGCGEGVVPIRLYIDTEGNVASMRAIPDRPVVDDLCHSAFWAATCTAVQGWTFAPAFRQTPTPGPDVDGDGRPDFSRWEQTPVMIYLDFEFAFRVVEGRGEVRAR